MIGTSPVASEEGRLAASDGLRLVYTLHRAETPKAALVICHGYADHRQRYRHLIAALVPQGISVLGFDLRGHGDSGGARGFVRHFDEYYDDLEVALTFARARLPDRLFLFGHSMGGLVAVRCLQERALALDGVVVCNPALELRMPVPGWKLAAARGLAKVVPGFRLESGLSPELISRDPEEVSRYRADPLVFSHTTARWVAEFGAAQRAAVDRPGDFSPRRLLVLLGLADRIIDPGVSRDFFERCAATDRQIATFPHHHHELFNEPPAARQQVFAMLSAFLLRASSSPSRV